VGISFERNSASIGDRWWHRGNIRRWQMKTDLKNDLLSICRKAGRSLSGMVLAEPYIPFVPDEWNGILILSEAQNLGKLFGAHVGLLRDRSPEERLRRLYPEVRIRSTNTVADAGDGGCYLVWGCWSSEPRDARLKTLASSRC
jgi:hypothetical protein